MKNTHNVARNKNRERQNGNRWALAGHCWYYLLIYGCLYSYYSVSWYFVLSRTVLDTECILRGTTLLSVVCAVLTLKTVLCTSDIGAPSVCPDYSRDTVNYLVTVCCDTEKAKLMAHKSRYVGKWSANAPGTNKPTRQTRKYELKLHVKPKIPPDRDIEIESCVCGFIEWKDVNAFVLHLSAHLWRDRSLWQQSSTTRSVECVS